MNLLEDVKNPLWKQRYVIYCYINKINGKKYVGQTKGTLKNRHRQHMYEANNIGHGFNYHLHNSIRKYGIENFELDILNMSDDYSIDMLEKYYIEKWNLTNRNNGYNSSTGGNDCLYTEERNKKISEYHKGKPKSENAKQNMSKTAKKRLENKENHNMYGKHHTEESRRKISENHANFKGEKHPQYGKKGKESKNSIKVIQYDYNMNQIKIWDCIADVERELNICSTSISRCCKGKCKSAGKDENGNKIYWRYYNEEVK